MIIAIDPGKNGGIAWLDFEGTVQCKKMPATDGDIYSSVLDIAYIEGSANTKVYLEKVGGFIGKQQPGSRMFEFGRGYGFLLGICAGLHLSVNLVRPQEWQKTIHAGTSRGLGKTAWKNKLKGVAQRIYPDQAVTLATADALLILEHARLREKNHAHQ